MGKKARGADGNARAKAEPAGPEQAARVERLKEMIRKGEYDTQEKIEAILEGFIKDLI